MNVYLNYVIEANIGLCLFLLAYVLLLKNETDFRFKRLWLLIAAAGSLIFPLIHANSYEVVPALGDVIPMTWLPEFVVEAEGESRLAFNDTFNVWQMINIIYMTGVSLLLLLFIIRIIGIAKLISKSTTYERGDFRIIESDTLISSFSFFKYIVIGNASQLSHEEKQQIIEHESEHARKYHSADVMLIHMMRIIFWFNPLIKNYEKIFVQLHEFEADARAVENRDTNDYCSLVAKVALLSADIKLANHFSNSLTLKRIEMMRTIKTKIKRWKVVALAMMVPMFFFIAACQDQVMTEVTDIAKNSTMTMDYPPSVQTALNKLKQENPEHNFIVIVPDEMATDQAENLQKKLADYDVNKVKAMHIMKDVAGQDGVKRNYMILDYNEEAKAVAEKAAGNDQIFMVVEETATYPGGMDALRTFLSENLVYPEEARKRGIEGTVFVSFVIGTDGALSDFNIVKGVGEWVDEAAVNVVKKMPAWSPGKQNGKVVKSRYVLPINFKLNNTSTGGK
jgi:TonB family protein